MNWSFSVSTVTPFRANDRRSELWLDNDPLCTLEVGLELSPGATLIGQLLVIEVEAAYVEPETPDDKLIRLFASVFLRDKTGFIERELQPQFRPRR